VEFRNAYEDAEFAEAYSKLEFPGTYHLAYRDLPQIIREHVRGRAALDFGCGAGRSTRFLRQQGYEVDVPPGSSRHREMRAGKASSTSGHVSVGVALL